MAALGDYYVNDAFSAAHRAHSSTVGITKLLPSFAGRAMERELKALEQALEIRSDPLPRWWAGPRFLPSWQCLATWSTKLTTSSSAAAWPILSCSARGRRRQIAL